MRKRPTFRPNLPLENHYLKITENTKYEKQKQTLTEFQEGWKELTERYPNEELNLEVIQNEIRQSNMKTWMEPQNQEQQVMTPFFQV